MKIIYKILNFYLKKILKNFKMTYNKFKIQIKIKMDFLIKFKLIIMKKKNKKNIKYLII